MLKFFADDLLGSNLSRANEMLLGSILPIFLLGLYELYAKALRKESLDYLNYRQIKLKNPVKEIKNSEQNSFWFFGTFNNFIHRWFIDYFYILY